MKKKSKILSVPVTLLILCTVLLMGCKKTHDLGVYDKNTPEDQLCTLEIAGNIQVDNFNGNKVKWTMLGSVTGGSEVQAVIKIPAGTHEMKVMFAQVDTDGVSATVKDVDVSNTFIAGRTYRLTAILHYPNGETKDTWKGMPKSINNLQRVSFNVIDKTQ